MTGEQTVSDHASVAESTDCVAADSSKRIEPKGPPLPVFRAGVGGVLMGLAMLVPGVSGGTMILVTGLYDEFITSIADVTRFRLTRRNLLFLAIVGGAALVAIALLAGTLSRAVTLHRSAMFSLFIGLTLGGVPLLLRLLGRPTWSAWGGLVFGIALMLAIVLTKTEPPDRAAIKAAVAAGNLPIIPDYATDVFAGALGMSAMVLPGVSGAYMVLVLGRYETILASISAAMAYARSAGSEGSLEFLRVLLPVAIGAVLGILLLSNFLKWMLHHHAKPTLGALLGILLGSVVGIWPFEADSQVNDYLFGGILAVVGLIATVSLSRLSAQEKPKHEIA